MILLISILAEGLFIILLSRPSHEPALYDPISTSYTLSHSYRSRLFALEICLHMPVNHYFLFVPLMTTIDLYDGFFLFCVIIMPIYAGLELLVQSYKQSFVITQDSIVFNRVIFKSKIILWTNVKETYVYRKSILIKSNDGTKINIGFQINGIPELLKVMDENLPKTITKLLFERLGKYGFAA